MSRQRDPEHRRKIVYSLTQKGRDLVPSMLSITNWAEKYDENRDVSRSFIRRLRTRPKELQREVLEALPDTHL